MNKHKLYIAIVILLIISGALSMEIYSKRLNAGAQQIQPIIPSKPPPIIPFETILKPHFPLPPIQKPNLIKIIQSRQPKLDPTTAKEISKAILMYSKKFQFPPELIIAIIERESSFNPVAISKSGCVGLMQINRKFHKEKLKKLNIKGDEIFYVNNNIHTGCMILREYFDSTGSISGALKKYLGANNRKYLLDILTSFADLMIIKK